MAKDSIFSEKRRRGLSRLGNAVYLYILLAMVILVVLYKIWSLPFDFVVQRVVLPTSYAITSIAKSVIHPFSVFKNISSLEAENKRLENENTSLTAKLTQVNNQNEILQAAQSEAKLSQGLNFDTVKARVIGQTPYSYNQVYIINVGTNDGLKEGAGVLSNGSLIGKIFKIYSDRSEVVSIFSHDSQVPARLETSNDSGLLQGGLEGLVLTDVPISTKIQTNDLVLTSGLGGDLPAGIVIGKIDQIIGLEGSLFQKAKVSPVVVFSNIQVVSVVK